MLKIAGLYPPMVEKGITLGQWIRDYDKIEHRPTAEDVAWACCDLLHWRPTPQLIAYMTKMVEDEGLLAKKED